MEWWGLSLPAIVDPDDAVIAHGLASSIKYVRIVRRKLNGCNRFYVQLVNEGKPYVKGKNRLGRGDVGLDLGPSTIATVVPEAGYAGLSRFCDELEQPWKEIDRQQHHIDRQRRANNPQNYNPDGTVKPGRKPWVKSRRQLKAETKLAAYRKFLHGCMVNERLHLGNRFFLEDISCRALQRRLWRRGAAGYVFRFSGSVSPGAGTESVACEAAAKPTETPLDGEFRSIQK